MRLTFCKLCSCFKSPTLLSRLKEFGTPETNQISKSSEGIIKVHAYKDNRLVHINMCYEKG